MTDNNADLLAELTSASRTLTTVIQNGLNNGVIKVEAGYEDMLSGPMGVVTMITDALPGGPRKQWDGELHQDEVREERIQSIGDDNHEVGPTGCRLTHKPTGIVREAMSTGDYDRNKRSAWESLSKAVEKRYKQMGV